MSTILFLCLFLLDRTSPLLKKEEEDRSSNTN